MAKTLPIIQGVAIYPNINKPAAKYKTDGASIADQEYVTQLLVTKADNKKLRKDFPNCNLPPAKEFTAKEFEKNFKFVPPKEYDAGDDEYYVIKFSKYAAYKAKGGNPPEPTTVPELVGKKAVNKGAGIYLDAEGNKFDQTVNLNGGTVGVVQFKERALRGEGNEGKVKLDLHKFQVLKLVEYVGADEDDVFGVEESDDEDASAFDMDDSDDTTETTKKAPVDDEEDDWDE